MTAFKTALYCGASLAARALLAPMRLLPVKRKRVLFVSFRGKQYSCNPRAISEKLEGRGREIVWAFGRPEEFAYLKDRGITVIRDRGARFIYYALTSRVVVTNTYYKPYLPRRGRQFYLRTWHGGGAYKRVTYPAGVKGLYIRLQQQGADLYLSSSKAFTEQTLRGAFGYRGEVLECGMPRNDVMVNGQWRSIGERTRRELSLEGKKTLLYAPTYREAGGISEPDFEAVKRALTARFGGDWVILFRGHHVDSERRYSVSVKDVTGYEDMRPLLCMADALLTDYSSSIWDMCLTGKPAFLYCPDIAGYRRERDFFTDIASWPFPMGESTDMLCRRIREFDPDKYARDADRHLRELVSRETGRAAEEAVNRILEETK